MAIDLHGTGASELLVRRTLGLPTLFPTGGNDTAQIVAALTAAGANGTVRLGPGIFIVDTDSIVPDDGQRIIGYGPFFTKLETTDLTGVLIDCTGVGDVQVSDVGIYLEGLTSAVVGIDLDASFRCTFERVRISGDHTASTAQVNTVGTRFVNNAGDNRFIDCDWRNLGTAIDTESIMNHVIGSRFGTCWYGIRGGDAAGSAIGAGISVQGSSFTSSAAAVHTTSWVKIDGTSNLWWFDNCWFEGAVTAIDVGSASYGPYGFSMVNCKVSAETTCINLATSRQTHLANVTFNGDNGGVDTPAELVIDASGCPDGTAINLISLQASHVDATFPEGWSVLGREQARIPHPEVSTGPFTPGAVSRWYCNPLTQATRALVPTLNRLYLYPVFSGPDGCTISNLDIATTIVGSAGSVARVGLWTIRNQDRPFAWVAATVWADLTLDGGTVATDSGTGQKIVNITDTAIPANTWFAVGVAHQVATAATCTVEGQSGGSWWTPLGCTSTQGAGGTPGLALYQDSVTGAFASTFTVAGIVNTGGGVGFQRSV